MTAWCYIPTIFKRRYVLRTAGLITLCVALTTTLLFANVSRATAGINQTLSFSGRLQSSTGAVVPDGHYNIQFKLYQDGAGTSAGNSGGTLKWTETYKNNGGTSGVEVKNGFFSVNLGSVNPFGTSVDWNQDTLWLSMNVAGSATACTTFGSSPCSADGEMLPMKRITSTPYAMQAGDSNKLGGKTASDFVQFGQGVQDDASTNTSSIFINKTGSGNLIQLQASGVDLLNFDSYGNLNFSNEFAHTISVAASGAQTNGNDLNVSAGAGGCCTTATTGGTLNLQGGHGGGGSGAGGDVVIDSGLSATETGTSGSVYIGAAHASTIQIGSTSLAGNGQTIIVGGDENGGTQNIIVGNGSGSGGGTTTIQSKDNTEIKTNGTTRATFDNAGNLALTTNTSIQADSTSAFNVTDTDSNSVFKVDTTNKQVTIGTVDPTTLPTLSVTQTNTSDAALEVKNAASNYILGIDASDGNKFKLGLNTTVTNGTRTASGQYDSSNANNMLASLVQATTTGTVTTIRAHVGAVAGHMAAALYTDNGSQTAPATLIANSTSVTPSANSWVTFTISSSNVTAGSYYWIVTNADNATTAQDFQTGGGILAGRYKTSTTYGTWPSSPSMSSAGPRGWAVNMDITPSTMTDQFANSAFSVDNNGSATFRSVVSATNAFSVQATDGSNLFNVNSNNGSIQIGDGNDVGAPTLFALDQATSAPTVDSSMLGSMYYDTTIGKVRCYEADGWGACGEAPDTFVTLSPEYANAVMNGADIGTITSDLCSDTLNINDGSSSQPTICGTNETRNFYKWTSAETTDQTRSIYVTYQLPSNFKNFVSGTTSLMGRTNSADSNVSYQIYRDHTGSSLASCGSAVSVSTGSQSTWQTAAATGGADPQSCGFVAGDSILIRINLTAKNNANAYVSNLGFVFSNN